MKHTKALLDDIYEQKLLITKGVKGDQINQTVRNGWRTMLLEAIQKDMIESIPDLEVYLVKNGLGLKVSNKYTDEGYFPVVLTSIWKMLDTDIDELHQEYLDNEKTKMEKAKAKAKEEKIKFDNAEKKRIAKALEKELKKV